MSSVNYSSLPSVVELRTVRARDEFRWKKMGKITRLPWSFKPEEARGVYIFRTRDEDCGEVVWQIGIGHCDTKTKPKRLIMTDVDGEHLKVISTKDYFSYPQFFNFADAKAAFGTGSIGVKSLWQSLPHADSTEKSGWTSDFHDCEVLDVRDSDESFYCRFENETDPTDRCRWVPFPCLFSLPAFEKYVQERFPSQAPQTNDAPASSQSNADTAATITSGATLAMPATKSSPPAPVASSACVAAASPAASSASRPAAAMSSHGDSNTIVAPPSDHPRPQFQVPAVANAPPSSVVATPVSAPVVPPSPVSSASSQFSSLSSVVSYLSQRYFLFVAPVNPKHFPGYSKIVKNPMSLQVITNKIAKQGSAYDAHALWQDIQLMCNNCRQYWTNKDPMLVSQADALQAEASTKLKGMLAAAATVPPAPTQVAATPVVTSAADAGCKKAPTPADASSTKRPRDAVDERAPKKPAQEQPTPSVRALPSEASANISKSASVQSSVQQASRSSDVQNTVLAAAAAATHVATPSATKLTENSVSSLEGDCAEVEDIQAKVQAELAWYRQQMAEKERRDFVETAKKAERKSYEIKYAAELMGQTLYVQPLQPLPGMTKEEHSKMPAVDGEIWLPCVDQLLRPLQRHDLGSSNGIIPQFAPWW